MVFVQSDLTGRYLKKAILDFNQTTFEPIISLEFNDEGGKLFAKMTKENVGKSIAIFLDGAPISVPNVREEITGGKAQITGPIYSQGGQTFGAEAQFRRFARAGQPYFPSRVSGRRSEKNFGQRSNGWNLRNDFGVFVSCFVVQIAGLGGRLGARALYHNNFGFV